MAILGGDGNFISSNKALCNILQYSEDELCEMTYNKIASSLDQRDIALLLEFSSGRTISNHQWERTIVRKDKTLIPVLIRIDRIEHSFPGDAFLLLTIEDLSGHKAKETELSRRQTEVGVLASLLIQSQEDERKRLSRELHDDIGQRLSLAASEAAMLASQPSFAHSVSADRLENLRDELDCLCTDVHEMSHDLHSYKLQHLGLKSALKDLCRRFSNSDFRVELYAEDVEEPVSKNVALCLYRVAQESLNNAIKHARTSVVAVTLTKLQSTFYMAIQDSGVGFDSTTSSQGLGLVSMSERLRLVNGQFRLHSVPGRGTEIWVAIPDETISLSSCA
jgi:PAS domain S-box-containing protein